MKSIKKVLLIFIMIISIFGITNVKALGKDIKVTGASVKDKSGTITVIDPVLTDNVVTSNITFNKVGDFVTFEFEIKNNESEKYKIESIKDNNTNDNIKIEYSFSKEYISSGNTGKVTVKLSYKNKLVNQEKINLNNLAINMTLLNEEGNSSEIIINNPTTGDSILHYLVLLIISVTGIIFILKKKRYKGLKVGSVLLLIAIIMVPFVVLAQEKYEINLKFNDIEVKGEFEKYNITINPENGSNPITREVTYGQPIGDLPDVSKEGYDFDKWVDGKGNKVTKETIITGPIEIEAKYNVIKYDITYNLNGGKLSTGKTNPSKYTIENDAITLNNPSKDGYTFTGWTGTGIDTKTTSVTIEAGSTGNREYTANYSANENTPYKVIHRYKNLNETYTEEEVTEYGETDKKIDAPIKSKKGFVNPNVQKVTVKADGTSKVTYTYEREKYNFSISDRTYIDNSSTDDGKYPYETEIKVKAIERDGYDFAWSDGKTELERTFKIDENTTLTPVYTAKTNIPYKVVHQKQKITLDGYEIADTQNLKGTTDSEITPAVNTYEGFTSPQAQKVTIKGDGSTVVTYNYDRIMYDFSTNNNENVTSTKEDGRYPYGTEITLTAKEKQGYTFSKWSNNETTNPLTITLDSDLTIEPVYTSDGYTVTFNSNGGGNVNSITVDAGETIQSFTTPTAPSGKIFDGWYTDLESGSKVNTPYTPEGNITLYAHWNNNSFSEVFSEPGECTFNGSNGVLTGDNCSYANGINKYIDTGINLYNSENHDKDYEIGFTIVSYNPSEQVKQATFMNTKLEGNNYPGLVFRRKDQEARYDLSSRNTSTANARALFNSGTIQKFKVYRITNTETGVQEIFYSINDEEKIKINDLSQFNPEFDLSVWFGAAPTNASATAAQRILVNTTLKDMYIKLGTYQESSNTETYKVTYNANGGSVSPTSKTINIGDQIGTLPTPTPPTNKTFDGWYTELTGGVKVTSSYIPNNNITIYARYINDISGATISPSSISIINGNNQTITVSNVGEEYTFRSNNTNVATVDSTGKVTGTGAGTTTITITGSTSGKTRTINVTVEPSSYTVTLNANGGSVNPTSITVNNGDAIGTLPEPTPPTNKTFDGWYTELTGGIEVTSSYIPNSDIEIYARYVDIDTCNGFSTDSWSTIRDNLESDSSYYAIGCEKEVELDMNDDGTNESYTVRLANTSTPEVCNTEGYSQTACGTVIEFVDVVGSAHKMNPTKTNSGGWKETEMVTYLNIDIFDKLPSDLQSVIIPTYPIVSGSGKTASQNITELDIDKNRLYLLSTREIGYDTDIKYDNKNDVTKDTRPLDYYVLNSDYKSYLKGSRSWWLRSCLAKTDIYFYYVLNNGNVTATGQADYEFFATPAFRIGTMPKFTVTFDTDDGSSIDSQTITYGEKATRPTTDPTKTGYTFDDWYTDDTYTTKFDFNTPITSDTTIYAHFVKVCANNENITRLSENTCSNNESITIGDGIVCKRAVKLHEETCSQTSGSDYCSGAGYTTSGSKGTSTITYGSCGTSGTLSSGDAFTCDVNGDGDFDELTERFYYVSDYYDTSAKKFDDSTAVLIYYNNVTSGVSCNNSAFAYDSSNENWHGPRTLVSQLPTTSQWSNVSLKSDTRAILGEYQSTHDSPTTTGGTLPTDFSYEGYAARLLTAKELMAGCNLTEVGRYTTGELDSCNYVMENTKYAKSSIGSYGGWLETPYASDYGRVLGFTSSFRYVGNGYAYYASILGARPAIEVLKSKISY